MCIGLARNCPSSSVQTREDAAVGCLRNTPICVLIHVSKGISRCVFRTDIELSFFSADQEEISRLFKEHDILCINLNK